MTMKFRKKPIVIDASQFRREPQAGASHPAESFLGYPVQRDDSGWFLTIPTLEGPMRASEGDWIVTGVKGERYPVKPDVFEATYEAAV